MSDRTSRHLYERSHIWPLRILPHDTVLVRDATDRGMVYV